LRRSSGLVVGAKARGGRKGDRLWAETVYSDSSVELLVSSGWDVTVSAGVDGTSFSVTGVAGVGICDRETGRGGCVAVDSASSAENLVSSS